MINSSKFTLAEPQTFAKIKSWLYEAGASFDNLEVVNFQEGYRGVISTKPINKKQRIVFIPRSHLITLELARQDPICRQIINKNVQLLSPKHTFLAIFLLQELTKDKESNWKPYIDILPKNLSSFPINYSNEELSQLIGSPFLMQIHQKVFDLKKDFDQLIYNCPAFKKYQFKDFCWARTVVGSRMFGVHIDGIKTDILAPFADMLNHRLPKETAWNYLELQQGFVIESLVDLPENVQIFDSYGKKCNTRYLLNYGFIMQDNPQNQICLRVNYEGNYRDQKLEMIKKKDGAKVLKISMNMNDNNFYEAMGNLRFKNINQISHLALLEKISGIKITNEPYQPSKTPPITMDIEINTWSDLQQICCRELKEYSTSFEEDEAMLKNKLTQNLRNILHVRIGQKKIYSYYAKNCKEVIQVLEKGYVKAMEHIVDNQEKQWAKYLFKILSIMPHERKSDVSHLKIENIEQYCQILENEEELSQ